jgi:CheY-like chemotaxis protein
LRGNRNQGQVLTLPGIRKREKHHHWPNLICEDAKLDIIPWLKPILRVGKTPHNAQCHCKSHSSFNVPTTEHRIILVAEDREEDIILITKAFEKAASGVPLRFVRDGEEAIDYLAGKGKYSNRLEYPLPTLLLLDLKMPRMGGFEVLEWLRQQPNLANIRVIVLTSSAELRDVNKAYGLGANSFLVKPLDFEETVSLAAMLDHYWVRLNKVPETPRSSPLKSQDPPTQG